MLYIGTNKQREILGDMINDIDMELIYTNNKQKIETMEEKKTYHLCDTQARVWYYTD